MVSQSLVDVRERVLEGVSLVDTICCKRYKQMDAANDVNKFHNS